MLEHARETFLSVAGASVTAYQKDLQTMILNMTTHELIIEAIGWASTFAFLFSIIVPRRERLHQLGVFAAVTTGIYAYAHGATAIWVKWFIAFFFHAYMIYKIRTSGENPANPQGTSMDLPPKASPQTSL